jgi:choline dehydrogenase-like flavoprotein
LPRTIGVRCTDGSHIDADHVVVCAGGIGSPALLLRSGLGCTPGRPIGQGLRDHPSATLTLGLRAGVEQDLDGLVIGASHRVGEIQLLSMNHLGRTVPGFGALLVGLLDPVGVGSVELDPSDGAVVIRHPGVEQPDDRRRLADGVAAALETLAASPFGDIVETIAIDDRGTPADALTTGDGIQSWMRGQTATYRHVTSTCAMGRVVDADGRLDGVANVYIADASVFPSIPRAATHLPTTMLAERLVARWRRQPVR